MKFKKLFKDKFIGYHTFGLKLKLFKQNTKDSSESSGAGGSHDPRSSNT